MAKQSLVALTFLTLLLLGAKAATFTFKNNCPFTIWPGTLTGGGLPQLPSTGFVLSPSESFILSIPPPWSGRFWARTSCSTDPSGKFTCETGDCGSGLIPCNGAGAIPPVSLAEFTLANNGGLDFYDISLVDGFNLPVSVTPEAGLSSYSRGCNTTSCPANVNSVCPPSFAVRDSEGSVIACKSACVALNEPKYCCTGEFDTPEKCPPSNYSNIFKEQCPQAYSYAYDDKSSTFTCSGGVKYTIEFCP